MIVVGMATCSLPNCENPSSARGWCRKHYMRWYKTGDPEEVQFERREAGADGWKIRYDVDENGCWIWNGTIDRHGYGEYKVLDENRKSRTWRAHRFVYTQIVRPLGKDESLDHLCRVHACVNPCHLDPVSHAVNVDRGNGGAGKARKTHCKNGHEYTPENTVIVTDTGGRNCRTCLREQSRVRMERMRERRRTKSTGPSDTIE